MKLPEIGIDEMAAFRRFCECVEDGEGYDVPKQMMQRIAKIGLVCHVSHGIYETTDFGVSLKEAFQNTPRRIEFKQYAALTEALRQVSAETKAVQDFLDDAAKQKAVAAPVVPDTAQPQEALTSDDMKAEMHNRLGFLTHKQRTWVIDALDEVLALRPAQAAPAMPELRNLRQTWMESDFTVSLSFASCRAASAFKIAIDAAKNPDERGSEG